MGNLRRNTALRDRHRATIRRQGRPCSICHQPIDYGLPYLHPQSFVVDHVIPLARGGPDTIANKAPAHRACNRAKGDRIIGEAPRMLTYVTTRAWTPGGDPEMARGSAPPG